MQWVPAAWPFSALICVESIMRTQPTRLVPAQLPDEAIPPPWFEQWLAMLPELSMLATVIIFVTGGMGPYQVEMPILMLALFADGATLMAFSSLIDIATRLKKPMPWWLAIPVGLGVLVMNGEVIEMLGLVWSQGLVVFLPFTWTLLDRIRQLWTLPPATAMEKIRRRTMTFDRLYVGLFVVGMWLFIGLALMATGVTGIEDFFGPQAIVLIGIVFYSIAAFNAWRVYQPAFSRRPRSLLPQMDKGESTSLDPL
jgi:hypothetical protein